MNIDAFETNRSLRNLFVDERINLWKDRLPNADSVSDRVDGLIVFLYDKKNKNGSNGLILFLNVLAQSIPFQDEAHGQLVKLIDELLHITSKTPAPSPDKNTSSTQPQSALENITQNAHTQTASITEESNSKKDFFISYNRHDKLKAEWIAWQLEEAGYSTIIQSWDFRPGGNFVADMQLATSSVKRTIAVLSPDYLASIFTQPEWNAAFAQDPTGTNGILLPVKVRECTLTGLLPQIVYIDLVGLSESDAKTVLLEGVNKNRAKPTTSPKYTDAP